MEMEISWFLLGLKNGFLHLDGQLFSNVGERLLTSLHVGFYADFGNIRINWGRDGRLATDKGDDKSHNGEAKCLINKNKFPSHLLLFYLHTNNND